MFNIPNPKEVIGGWMIEGLKGLANEIAQGFFDMALTGIQQFLIAPTHFDRYPYFNQMYDWIFSLSVTLGILCLVFNGIRYYFQEMGGYTSRPPSEFVIKAMLGAFGALSAPWLMKHVLIVINNGWVEFVLSKGVNTQTIETLLILPGTANLTLFLMAAGLSLLLLILGIQAIIRIGEIGVQLLFSPIAFFSMQNEDLDFFPIWWRETLITIFQQSLQISLLWCVLNMVSGGTEPMDYIFAFALMLAILRGPGFLRKFLYYSSGAGRAAVGMAGSAGKFAMYKLASSRIMGR